MRVRNLLLLGALAGAAACGRESGVTSSEGVPADLSSGRSVLLDGRTFVERSGKIEFADGANGGYVRGWASSPNTGSPPYTMGPLQANGNEASYVVERPGYQARIEAVPYAPGCRFSRWVIGLNTYNTSTSVSLGDYLSSNSFVAEFICTA